MDAGANKCFIDVKLKKIFFQTDSSAHMQKQW